MTRHKLLKLLVLLMVFIFVLDLLGRTFYWYYTIWYFDLITHLLGGFWVGLFFLYFFLRTSGNAPIVKVLLATLFIGIVWEIFEYIVYQRIGGIPFSSLDTMLDLVVDMAGGGMAILYVYKKIEVNETWNALQR